MRVVALILIAGSVATNAWAQAALYRCAVDGQTKFQDRPCAGGGAEQDRVEQRPEAVRVTAPEAAPQPAAPVALPQPPPASVQPANVPAPQVAAAKLPARPDRETLRQARMANRVLLGMTQADVLQVAGKYRDHSTSAGADVNGEYEIWTFHQRLTGFPQTVAFRRGVVVQFSDGPLPYLSY
jgi:hypothetical protein